MQQVCLIERDLKNLLLAWNKWVFNTAPFTGVPIFSKNPPSLDRILKSTANQLLITTSDGKNLNHF